MKNIMLATAVLALTASAAFAENPTAGESNLYVNDNTATAEQKVDYTAPASISTAAPTKQADKRSGDASPANGE